MKRDYWENLTKEEAVAEYRLEIEEAIEMYDQPWGFASDSYEVAVESINNWWEEQYPQWFDCRGVREEGVA